MFLSANVSLPCVVSCFVAQVGCVYWGRLRQWLHSLVSNPFFDFVIVLCLIANIIIMALVHFPLTVEFEANLSRSNLVSSIKNSTH